VGIKGSKKKKMLMQMMRCRTVRNLQRCRNVDCAPIIRSGGPLFSSGGEENQFQQLQQSPPCFHYRYYHHHHHPFVHVSTFLTTTSASSSEAAAATKTTTIDPGATNDDNPNPSVSELLLAEPSWTTEQWRAARYYIVPFKQPQPPSVQGSPEQGERGDNGNAEENQSLETTDESSWTMISSSSSSLPLVTKLELLNRLCLERPQSTEAIPIFYAILHPIRFPQKNSHTTTTNTTRLSERDLEMLNTTVRDCVQRGWRPHSPIFRLLMEINCHYQRPDCAQAWLEQQWQQMTRDANPFLQPNRHAYTTVLQAYAKKGTPQAAEQAGKLMNDLLTRYRATNPRNPALKPTEAAYVSWIITLSKQRRPEAAEQVLVDMCHHAESDDFYPSSVVYTSVMHAWMQVGAIDRAEHVFRHMCHSYLQGKNKYCLPSTESCTTLIAAWAKSEAPDAPLRAEALVQSMLDLYQRTGKESVRPNVYTFTAVLDCWAKSNHKQAAQKAQALLDQMVQLSAGQGDDGGNMQPNLISFNSVMDAWARSGHTIAPKKVEELNHIVVDWSRAGRIDPPDHFTYLIRIITWDRAGKHRKDAAQRAHDVMLEMIDAGMVPGTHHFNRVLHAWAEQGNTEMTELVWQMMQQYASNPYSGAIETGHDKVAHSSRSNPPPKPNSTTLNFMLLAWIRSDAADAPLRAQACFDDLVKSSSYVRPGLVTYTSLLRCWGKAAKRAASESTPDTALTFVKADNDDVTPTTTTTTTTTTTPAVGCLSRTDIITGTWQVWKMIQTQQFRPDRFTYGTLLQILIDAGGRTNQALAQEVIDHMKHQRVEPDSVIWRLAKDLDATI